MRRSPAPDPLDDAVVPPPPPEDDVPPSSEVEPDDDAVPEDDAVPDEDAVPASGGAVVPPVTVMVRVVFTTASFAVPAPLADMAATHIVMLPFVFGAVNENLYVPVAPFGGGSTATTSSGVSTGNGTMLFCPAVTTMPSLNAALNDVRVRVPLITIVTSFFEPACTVVGMVMFSVGTGVLGGL